MIDKTLKIKLFLVFTLFFVMLYHHQTLFLDKKEIFSFYSQISFMIASACLGVIFSASIYNLAFFLYTKDRRFLFYTLAQWSILLFLVTLDSLYIEPFSSIFVLDSFKLHDLSQISIVVFSLLFIREFLNLSKNSKKLLFIIKIILFLMGIDLLILLFFNHAFFIRLIPVFVFIWFIVSESKRCIEKKDSAFWFFYYGWHFVIVMAILVYTEAVNFIKDDFPFLHITLALEAMIMSMAIAYQIKLLEDEKREHQSLLLQQSRLASMGEMIATIAHQWRQPLTHLSFILMNIKKNLSDPSKAKQKLQQANEQISYMSTTIDDFRNFYNPSKNKEEFTVSEAVKDTFKIIKPSLENNKITFSIETREDFKIYGNKNELQQVLLNLINNAKDALITDNIAKPSIEMVIKKPFVSISDNAKGISSQIESKIFEPYFSTKYKSDGIGLYISKTVIEKEFNGTISVQTTQKGTTFKLLLPFV